MTEQEKNANERDELDLDAETVKDLDVTDESAEAVLGGSTPYDTSRLCCHAGG